MQNEVIIKRQHKLDAGNNCIRLLNKTGRPSLMICKCHSIPEKKHSTLNDLSWRNGRDWNKLSYMIICKEQIIWIFLVYVYVKMCIMHRIAHAASSSIMWMHWLRLTLLQRRIAKLNCFSFVYNTGWRNEMEKFLHRNHHNHWWCLMCGLTSNGAA